VAEVILLEQELQFWLVGKLHTAQYNPTLINTWMANKIVELTV
jgi:hypothetical protein